MRVFASNNDPHDFCPDCAPSEGEAEEEFGDVGDGPDGRGNCFAYDTEHPPYDDWDHFRCYRCGKRLSDYEGPSSFWATL